MTELLITEAARPIGSVLFAHGAGADMQHAFMTELSQQFSMLGLTVIRFNFPYMIKRAVDGVKRPPDRMPMLINHFCEVLNSEQVQTVITNQPIYLAGKSMGCRVALSVLGNASLFAQYATQIKGAICLGYPFHAIGKPEKLRLNPINECLKPILIIQGERDKLGDKTAVLSYQLPNQCQVHFINDGDHDLKPRIKSGYCYQQQLQLAMLKIKSFVHETK